MPNYLGTAVALLIVEPTEDMKMKTENMTIDEIINSLKGINFFIGGLRDREIKYYYEQIIEKSNPELL